MNHCPLQRRPHPSLPPLLLLLLTLALSSPPCLSWKESAKDCHADCTKLGNCNREFGTCECPFGRIGPSCGEDMVPACRPSGSPHALPFVGTWLLKSCECWKQLMQHQLPRPEDKVFVVLSTLEHGWGDMYCYERDGVPPNQQYSDIPFANASSVKWCEPVSMDPAQPLRPRPTPPSDNLIKGHMVNYRQLPLDSCPGRCGDRGACLQLAHREHGPRPDEQPRCHCIRGSSGPGCEKMELTACLNSCGGNGECVGGFCKCSPGLWGMDCTRSRAYAPDPDAPLELQDRAFSMSALRIYRYELPWHAAFFTEPAAREVNIEYMDGTYGAWEQFFQQFSPDWVTRTENPGEANLFYIPLLTFMKTDNTGIPQPYIQHVVRHLQQVHPLLWGRNAGKDHFLWLSNDQGACEVDSDPQFQNIIKIVHFAMQAPMPWKSHALHPLDPARQLLSKRPFYSCFLQEKDVAAPDNRHRVGDPWMKEIDDSYKEAREGQPRKFLLFFGGGIRAHDPHYSGGARQEFHKQVITQNHSDVQFGGNHELFRQSTFCLCPYGAGFGSRIGHAMMGACIPIILQDNVHQPLEDVLHYPDFTLRMRKSDIPQMMQLLRSMSPAQIQAYRENMYKVYRAFTWSVPHGGQAYNYTLRSLQRKLYNLWGHHY